MPNLITRTLGPALAATALCLSTAASGATFKTEVYEGRLGTNPIVLEVVEAPLASPGAPLRVGRYFYRKYRASIPLLATQTPEGLDLSEVGPGCREEAEACAVKATFKLKTRGDGVLTGSWTARDKIFPVDLKRVDQSTAPLDQPPSTAQDLFGGLPLIDDADFSDPYLSRQVLGQTLYSKEIQYQGVGTVTATDKDTGIHYVRLSRLANTGAMARTNTLLDKARHELVAYGLACREADPAYGPGAGTLGDWETYQSKVTYASQTLLVIQESGSTFCTGAHPNNSFQYRVYDLKRGEILNFNRVLKLSRDGKSAYSALLKKLRPRSPYAILPKSIYADCPSEDLATEEGYTLSFNAKGLVFSLTDVPHVMSSCQEDYYVVPYSDLKSIWGPEFKAYFPDK